jgi:hypothetical protein
MPGTLIYKKFISKRDVLAGFPDTIFLFGDNMRRQGYGGQAASMRDHPNSFGVPTKWAPDMTTASFFTNADFDAVRDSVIFPFMICFGWLTRGETVVIPADGLGTGLAELPTRAPKIFAFIEANIKALTNHAETVKHED